MKKTVNLIILALVGLTCVSAPGFAKNEKAEKFKGALDSSGKTA